MYVLRHVLLDGEPERWILDDPLEAANEHVDDELFVPDALEAVVELLSLRGADHVGLGSHLRAVAKERRFMYGLYTSNTDAGEDPLETVRRWSSPSCTPTSTATARPQRSNRESR